MEMRRIVLARWLLPIIGKRTFLDSGIGIASSSTSSSPKASIAKRLHH